MTLYYLPSQVPPSTVPSTDLEVLAFAGGVALLVIVAYAVIGGLMISCRDEKIARVMGVLLLVAIIPLLVFTHHAITAFLGVLATIIIGSAAVFIVAIIALNWVLTGQRPF